MESEKFLNKVSTTDEGPNIPSATVELSLRCMILPD